MKKIYKSIFIAFLGVAGSMHAMAQLTGVKNIPGDYATLALAITDLNAQGVGPGGVTINLIAGNPQTAPASGYVIGNTGSLVLTTSSAANQVMIMGNGNTITASPALTVASINDAIFKLIGADYITIAGFSLTENPANVISGTAATNNMTEFGIAQFYMSTTDGSQNNTFTGNTITLNKTYSNTFGIFSTARTSATNMATAADAAAGGSNSNTKVYSNNISNVNYGIVFLGSSVAAAMDNGNDVGGSSAATGNTITNWGKGTALSTYNSLTGNDFSIFFNHQVNDNISFNNITGVLTNAVTSGGIFKNYSVANPAGTIATTINSNTIAITNNGIGGLIGIISQGITPLVSTATISINSNVIQNFAITGSTATTAGITGIQSASLVGLQNITGNTVSNNSTNSTAATTGTLQGIVNTGACTVLNITGNTLSGNNYAKGVTGNLLCINNSSSSATVNATGNIIANNIISSPSSTTGLLVGVLNTGAAGTINFNNNTITGFSSSAATGQIQAISSNGAVTTAVNMNANSFGTAGLPFVNNTNLVAGSGAVFGTLNFGTGAATAVISMTNNDFYGVNYLTTTNSPFLPLNHQATNSLSQNISNNRFNNLSINTTGSVTFITNSAAISGAGSKTINGNSIVTAFNKTAVGGSVSFYVNGGSSSGGTESNQNNNFSNVTVTGATPIFGWDNEDGVGVTSSVKTISNNTFSNITGGTAPITAMFYGWSGVGSNASNNIIDNMNGSGFVTGVVLTGNSTAGTSQNFSQNQISNLTSAGDTVIAIRHIGGAVQNIFKNKIYNLQTNSAGPVGLVSAFWGNVLTGAGPTTTGVYNNLIGNLTAPNISSTDAIRAIYLASNEPATAFNVNYNTVYLNATSAGTDFGTAAVYHLASPVATVNAMTLTDNAFVNLSTAKGLGFTTVLQRSFNDLTNFVSTSNNNDYYAGTPSTTNLIYADGTNAFSTLAAYKTYAAPRDAASVTENPPFISTVGTNPGFLHIPNAAVTLLANGGIPVAGITDDYDGDARDATTPDIGADEFSLTVVAVRLQYFTGAKSGASNLLTWRLAGAVDENVILERSTDGVVFAPIYTSRLTAANSLNPLTYTDVNPVGTKDYYRLKITELSGRVTYSNIVVLLNSIKGTEIVSIAPNPVTDGTFKLNVTSVRATNMTVIIADMSGKIVSKQTITVTGGFSSTSLNVSTLAPGTYVLSGVTEDGRTASLGFIKK